MADHFPLGSTLTLLSIRRNQLLRPKLLPKHGLHGGTTVGLHSFVLLQCEGSAVTQLHISEVITSNTPHQIRIVQRTATHEYNYLANQSLIRF